MYMSRHSFLSKFLKEVSIIDVLIQYLKIPTSKCPYSVVIYYQFTALILLKNLVFLKKLW